MNKVSASFGNHLKTLTFAPGITTQNITVAVKGDLIDENDEQFTVNLSSPTNANIATSQGIGTILNDDLPPNITITDSKVAKPTSGTTTATFVVSLSAASGKTVTVNYATADNTAVAPTDYQAIPPTPLTFLPGTMSQPINVTVNGNALAGPNKTFFVNLSGAANANIADAQGQGTITSSGGVTLSISDPAVVEGNAGTTNAVFQVTLSSGNNSPVTVNYQTTDGTAAAGSDYLAQSGTLTFAASPTPATQYISVPINGDALNEDDEIFSVILTGPTNATIAKGQGVGRILNDDPQPTISIDNLSFIEPQSGAANAVFTLHLSAASGKPISVSYQTSDGSANAGSDYTAMSGTLNIPANSTTATISVLISSDALKETNETFLLSLSSPTNATLAIDKATCTIVDSSQNAPSQPIYLPLARR